MSELLLWLSGLMAAIVIHSTYYKRYGTACCYAGLSVFYVFLALNKVIQ